MLTDSTALKGLGIDVFCLDNCNIDTDVDHSTCVSVSFRLDTD